jgi:4-diphosphocytidyl-2-C-methyl-D-erythritol kinase
MSPGLRAPSFAKVNWRLKVEGRRADGYHQLTTVFQTITLSDAISFRPTPDPEIRLEVRGRTVSDGPDNLVRRAVAAVKERTRRGGGLEIVLEKKIPVGAGLGGGSSNAAVSLLAANQLFEVGLGLPELRRIAADLGADVPFFLTGGTALGLGRGDELRPLPDWSPGRALIVVFPGFPVATREAYAARDWGVYRDEPVLTWEGADNKIQRFCQTVTQGLPDLSWLENDFETIVFDRYPALVEAREHLRVAGCERVLLCGSGSALVGLAPLEEAEDVVREVSRKASAEVFLCHSLSGKQYRDVLFEAGLDLKSA